MRSIGSHIIQKQTVAVTVNGQVDGLDLQRQTDELVNKDLMPKLDRLMDKYGRNQWIRIDKLAIEVSDLQWDDFAGSFSDRILNEVEKELSRIVQSKPADYLFIDEIKEGETASQQQFIRLMIFTLKHGYLPWWSTIKTMSQWQEAFTELLQSGIVLNPNQVLEIKYILNKSSNLNRLNSFLSEDNNKYWLFVVLITSADKRLIKDLELFFEIISKRHQSVAITPMLRQILMLSAVNENSPQAMVAAFSTNAIEVIRQNKWRVKEGRRNAGFIQIPQDKVLQIALESIQKLSRIHGEIVDGTRVAKVPSDGHAEHGQKSIKSDEESDKSEEIMAKLKFSIENKFIDNQINVEFISEIDSIYINNAGLVILAPFLTAFFKKLNLVKDDKLTDKAKAITLLNYLVTGNIDFDEVDIVLNKIVCGEVPDAFIKPTKITVDEKQEADDLLIAVIEHWSVLKNTSPDGLRGTFLQREGRLMFADNKWSLKVQEQSFDMLLAHLPWGIGVVKLPWMEHVIYVEWI
jgi:hypothetical protein